MFALSVIEHLRLNFGLVVQNYTAHARAAERLAAAALKAKMAVLGLSALATFSIVLSVFRPAREYQIAAALLASVAFAVHIATVAYGIEARVYSHRLLAHRLWLMCERYRELLTEIALPHFNQRQQCFAWPAMRAYKKQQHRFSVLEQIVQSPRFA